jgi:DNA-binding LacI/PurR family transcriptional regulator
MNKLKQIATEAGVSQNTVLRVLRGENKEVWPSAIRRAGEIRELAHRLGYLPNGSARAMRRGSFNCVSLVLSTDLGRSYLPADLFNAIHDSLNEQGIRLIVSKLTDERLTDRMAVPSILRDWSCDGLLINYTDHIPAEMVELLDQYNIPSVLINSRQEHDCVYYDDFGGAMEATQHLIKLGHRRITYLDFTTRESASCTHYSRIDRYEGYVQAMRSAGLTPTDRDEFAGTPSADRLAATQTILKRSDRPTAVLSYDAGERLVYAASLAGLQVPKDLSVITFIDRPPRAQQAIQGENFFGRVLTAMRVPSETAGRRAVEMLIQKIAEPQTAMPPRVVPLELEISETTASCPE